MSKELIIVGSDSTTKTACLELMQEGHKIVVVEDTDLKKESFVITNPRIDFEPMKLKDLYYSEDRPKPKHHNKKYNNVNRKKNKASRKARKQNKRRHK